ncbi:NifB/NifX family molybdenum-iron cluster-binding protein [Sulfurimonas marina]|uniref:Dinitrogenase iron-molybdenum cofactor biosynthesis protein n=1 Tax=Sulfurimonas marina TaxID=2590551 RepID=A0A7M1AWG5_9BACT|nr:NifB/NifX family molybdenum-iron cluster-binding protein [Sulfurimonas marina]QOP40722.1 dinitrogenase iron-molybdenum cofactor biosynthesis protein [Sulfurimonas marina]
MLAIPLDNEFNTNISELYGQAPYFGLLNLNDGELTVIKNEVNGQGPKSAGFLAAYGVKATVFYHMGEGVYNSFVDRGMDVYTTEHTKMSLNEIYEKFLKKQLNKLDRFNYREKLDPGNGGACQCGCEG